MNKNDQTESSRPDRPQIPPQNESAPEPATKAPMAIRPLKLILWLMLTVVALGLGSLFATPIKAVFSWSLAKIGFGHDHAKNSVAKEDSAGVKYYTCGMHPWVILPKPGKCPICHMTLTPLDPKKFSGEVTIDPVVMQNIGVRIEAVKTGPLVRTIRTVGNVDYDEKLVRDINTKVSGWIEKLNVDYVGAPVKRGEVLFEVYSPDLYAAQNEYLIALNNRKEIGASFVPDASKNAADLIDAAKTRLLFFDVTEEQIQDLIKAGKPSKTMKLRSPYRGVVISKHANEGMKIGPGMRVYQIADLSKVWVMVTLYEYQLPYVKEGQDAVMTLPYIPGQVFHGKVVYIYPYVQARTREVQVRLEFDNPYGVLKPGMFANIELHNHLADKRTLAPRSAILDTGERQVAFVSLGEGKFEPRDLQLGIETSGGFVEVIEGLKPGEMVVTSGQFLLDSEAKTREALAKMVKGNPASEQKVVAAVSGKSELERMPAKMASLLTEALDAYLAIGTQLAADSMAQVPDSAKTLAHAVAQMLKVKIPKQPHFWHQHEEVARIKGKSEQLAQAQKIDKARAAYADLSIAMGTFLKATGVPPAYHAPVQKLHCPMFHGGQGGSVWLQKEGDVRNPYLGQAMLRCFDKRVTLPRTGGKTTPASPSVPKPAASSVHSTTKQSDAVPPAAAQKQVERIVTTYLTIQKTLVADQYEPVVEQIKTLRQAAAQLAGASDKTLARLGARVAASVKWDVKGLPSARKALAAFSDSVLQLVRQAPPSQRLYYVYCPMAKKAWLQTGKKIQNPYLSHMRRCGVIQKTIPAVISEK